MVWRFAGAVLAVAGLILSGCGSSGGDSDGSPGGKGGAAAKRDHDHEHGDAHDHAGHDHSGHSHAEHGPHKGHIVELGEEEYHAEWTHDDETGLVTVYILDSEMKNEVPIAATQLTITTQIGENTSVHELAAANPSEGDAPKASKFCVEDKSLVTALKAAGTKGSSAKLDVEINGKAYSAPVAHDAGHKH